jgi:aspartyl-tRNA(Asn)/glutamyl-tRNA(Gln) amidotransferase subunit A
MGEPYLLTARETVNAVRNGDLTAEECLQATLERIKEIDQQIHAYITLREDVALKRAREIDRKARKGKILGRLSGVCIALKDNLCTKDFLTTCGSRMLESFSPPYHGHINRNQLFWPHT